MGSITLAFEDDAFLDDLPKYQYKPLPDGPTTRILTLFPGSSNDCLQVHLEPFDLSSTEVYETISYVWGELDRTHDIVCNGARLQITRSLQSALRRLRP